MLQFILLQNRQGKTRLSKYYRPYTDEERLKIETEVHRIVTTRDAKFTNFVEFRSYKLIYRRYAGLFFTLAVDVHDNELLYFESIHLFVELLDQFFGNVCELDLVFNFNKVGPSHASSMPLLLTRLPSGFYAFGRVHLGRGSARDV